LHLHRAHPAARHGAGDPRALLPRAGDLRRGRRVPRVHPPPAAAALDRAAAAGFERAGAYPSVTTSRAIGRSRFLSAAWRNGPSLPALIGAVDVALFLTFLLHWPMGWPRAWQFWVATGVVAVLLGFYAASGANAVRPRRRRRWVIGLLLTGHTLAHLVVAWAVAALVAGLVTDPA